MNSDKNAGKHLPDGWVSCSSKSNPGRKYYFNKKTGKSSWTQPQADDKSGQSKHKNKKTRVAHLNKCKKEDLNKKTLKRKSDDHGQSSSPKKKQKYVADTPTTEKHNVSSTKQTPTKYSQSPKKQSPHSASKIQSDKNLANARLSHLRAQLEADVKKEESTSERSPLKTLKPKRSPATQTESQAKVQRTELKSPNLTESKCSTSTQSPSSDSLQSIPSPSQFLAANKIISSMKAQLPEEFSDKLRNKSTFADIEEGICKQTPEYPFMKHPATPPQFSEASKLVSAIKSKLSYKGSVNKELPSYTSAKDRMEAMRTRLSNEASSEISFLGSVDDSVALKDTSEAMDVDINRQIIPKAPLVQCTKDTIHTVDSKANLVLVVDTNIFIHELNVIKDVLNSHIKGYSEQPNLLVPWRVINELDRLKDNNNGNGAICKRAKAAMDYLYKSLPENTRIKGQSLRDANSHIYPCELPDDEILNCCLQQSERGKAVILVSNDKNLCNKAVINGVKSISLGDLRPLLMNKPVGSNVGSRAKLQQYEAAMYHLLATILENEMRAKYNNLWEHVLFKAPPWSFSDVLQCLLKHWIAVFNEVFPRIEHLITELSNTFNTLNDKNPKSLSQSEVSNFKELCLDVAKKCQIIPEYMELAKLTVERLLRECGSETERNQPERERDSEMAVIQAFEGLWIVFSSYCAKLATGLGVPNNLENKLQCDDPLSVLTSKYQLFYRQMEELTYAIKGALSIGTDTGEQLTRLENAFRDSLVLIYADTQAITRDKLGAFCVTCRNMLEEAYTKFSQLTEILAACKYKISND